MAGRRTEEAKAAEEASTTRAEKQVSPSPPCPLAQAAATAQASIEAIALELDTLEGLTDDEVRAHFSEKSKIDISRLDEKSTSRVLSLGLIGAGKPVVI